MCQGQGEWLALWGQGETESKGDGDQTELGVKSRQLESPFVSTRRLPAGPLLTSRRDEHRTPMRARCGWLLSNAPRPLLSLLRKHSGTSHLPS